MVRPVWAGAQALRLSAGQPTEGAHAAQELGRSAAKLGIEAASNAHFVALWGVVTHGSGQALTL